MDNLKIKVITRLGFKAFDRPTGDESHHNALQTMYVGKFVAKYTEPILIIFCCLFIQLNSFQVCGFYFCVFLMHSLSRIGFHTDDRESIILSCGWLQCAASHKCGDLPFHKYCKFLPFLHSAHQEQDFHCSSSWISTSGPIPQDL